jgi:hypothetical protein
MSGEFRLDVGFEVDAVAASASEGNSSDKGTTGGAGWEERIGAAKPTPGVVRGELLRDAIVAYGARDGDLLSVDAADGIEISVDAIVVAVAAVGLVGAGVVGLGGGVVRTIGANRVVLFIGSCAVGVRPKNGASRSFSNCWANNAEGESGNESLDVDGGNGRRFDCSVNGAELDGCNGVIVRCDGGVCCLTRICLFGCSAVFVGRIV